MKTFITLLFLVATSIGVAQTQLTFNTPIDTGVGLNRVITYPNVGTVSGQALDMVICINRYYSSDVNDTLWYPNVQFRAVSGDFNIKIPYIDTLTRCVDLTYKLVKAGTLDCVQVDVETIVMDMDSSSLRHEFITTNGFESVYLSNPTDMDTTAYGDSILISATNEVNRNDLRGSAILTYDNTCTFEITYCATANNNGGNSGFFMKTYLDSLLLMAIGDVAISDFNGQSDGCVNYLYWNVFKENNLKSYELQYSTDGLNFVSMGVVKPKNKPQYNYIVQSESNTNYYRLVMNYTDETVEYSKIIFVEADCVNYNVYVYPNPVGDGVNIISEQPMESVEIISSVGESLATIQANGQKSIHIDILNINTQTFLIKIRYNNGIVRILKLVKYL